MGNSESMQRELSSIFTQILPEESSLQIILYADKNIDDLLDDYVELRAKSSETMRRLAEKRAKFLSELAIIPEPFYTCDFRWRLASEITTIISRKSKTKALYSSLGSHNNRWRRSFLYEGTQDDIAVNQIAII